MNNSHEILKRFIKYTTMTGAVVLSTYFITNDKLELQEILMIGIISSIMFSIIDIYSPSIHLQDDIII